MNKFTTKIIGTYKGEPFQETKTFNDLASAKKYIDEEFLSLINDEKNGEFNDREGVYFEDDEFGDTQTIGWLWKLNRVGAIAWFRMPFTEKGSFNLDYSIEEVIEDKKISSILEAALKIEKATSKEEKEFEKIEHWNAETHEWNAELYADAYYSLLKLIKGEKHEK